MAGKRELLLSYLERGVAMIHLDARREGVSVPEQFASESHLRLNVSYRFGIHDFEVGEERVVATLSFGGRPFKCVVPWTAIFAMTSQSTGDGQVWPEDIPPEVLAEAQRQERPALKAVENETPPDDEPPKPSPAKKPNLRLVR